MKAIFTNLQVKILSRFKRLSMLPDGEWEWGRQSEKMVSKGEYQDGRQEGPWEIFYPNGQLEYKGN